jgi:hypothetical protein
MQQEWNAGTEGKDLIWIGPASFLKRHHPEIESVLERMVQSSFSEDEYPGEHHIPHFQLDTSDHEVMSIALYLPNKEMKHVSCFLSLNYIPSERSVTMWNLCSMDRGKGYASQLVEKATEWCNRIYQLPLRLKVYLYNPLFHQVIHFYVKRGFGLERIERNGKVICMIQHVSSTYEMILYQCWNEVDKNSTQERLWMTRRLLMLQYEKK